MTTQEKAIFNRTALLVGEERMRRLGELRGIVFGVGGVGSWCAEGLVRSGVRRLTIVDSDRVCITNVNRQLMATTETVGRVKVDVLRERLLAINPSAQIEAVQEIYSAATSSLFPLQEYDFVIDAIDSLSCKHDLIVQATALPVHFYSSMGAALKMDPTQVRVSEFWDIDGCPLARALRKRMRKEQRYPKKKFRCVWSPEVLPNLGAAQRSCGTAACMCPKNVVGEGRADLEAHEWCNSKAQINGTTAHITAIFGMMLSGLVVQDVCEGKY